MKKPSKNGKLYCIRVLLTKELVDSLKEEALKESRKLSPMLRRIVEERYQTRKLEPCQKKAKVYDEYV